MTLPRCYEIWSAWKRCPPLHIAFSQFIGAFGAKPHATAAVGPNDDGELLRDLGAMGVGGGPKLSPEFEAMMHNGTT